MVTLIDGPGYYGRPAILGGLSTDKKPAGPGIGNGSLFVEIDTGARYRFDAETEVWVLQPAGGGGGGSGTGTNYSTTEQTIGTWIDGKPLYQRTFTGALPNSGNWFNAVEIESEVVARSISGTFDEDGNGSVTTIPKGNVDVRVYAGWIQFYVGIASYAGMPFAVTVLYTKTTD